MNQARTQVLGRVVERWGLADLVPLEGGLSAHVFACRDASGRDLVLKVVPQSALVYAASADVEAAALEAWAGPHVPELVSVDRDVGVLLMSRVLPGSDLAAADDGEAVELVAPLINSLHSSRVPEVNPFPPLAEVASIHLRRRRPQAEREAPELVRLVDLAAVAAHELAEGANEQVLLHGDLMDKNLLMDGHRQVVAIDPMPRIGDPDADIGFWASARQPAGTINQRVERMSTLLGRNPNRATQWALVCAVSAACESWRADTPELRQWVQDSAR
jgi:streptomycin 6-kinase